MARSRCTRMTLHGPKVLRGKAGVILHHRLRCERRSGVCVSANRRPVICVKMLAGFKNRSHDRRARHQMGRPPALACRREMSANHRLGRRPMWSMCDRRQMRVSASASLQSGTTTPQLSTVRHERQASPKACRKQHAEQSVRSSSRWCLGDSTHCFEGSTVVLRPMPPNQVGNNFGQGRTGVTPAWASPSNNPGGSRRSLWRFP